MKVCYSDVSASQIPTVFVGNNYNKRVKPQIYLGSIHITTSNIQFFLRKVVRQKPVLENAGEHRSSSNNYAKHCYSDNAVNTCFYLFKQLLCSPLISRTDPFLFPPLLRQTKHSHSLRKASRSNSRPSSSNCMRNDVKSV